MLRTVKDLRGYAISATDGDIGRVDDLYFDDERWVIRYLVVDTGTWLPGRRVLISPIVIAHTDWMAQRLAVSLTKDRVRNSPDIDTKKPVSRQYEADYFRYYGYPYYWGGAGLWGMGAYPGRLTTSQAVEAEAVAARADAAAHERDDSHLRSSNEVINYHIQATDGEIGHIEDFLVDDETWAIRYLVVDTSNWWFGNKVLVAPQWIREVSWPDSKAVVDLTRQSVKDAPPYDPTRHLDRQQETGLYEHYGRPGYWSTEGTRQSEAPMRRSGVEARPADSLASLYDLDDYEVAPGEPDIRGWKVVTADGRKIGKVDDLIVDTSLLKVRYLELDLDEDALKLREKNRHTLLPVDHAALAEGEDRVIVDVSPDVVSQLPAFTALPMPPGYEEALSHSLHLEGAAVGSRARHARAADDLRIGKRGSRPVS